MWTNVIFGGTIAVFAAGTLNLLWHLRWMKRLPPVKALLPVTGNPRCSVVIAARNEELRIEETIRRLLAQHEVEVEVILVDDRSTDGTSNVVKEAAKRDARLRVIRIEKLPDGWLGKCHACHIGASVATGEWLLFTDADCWLHPDVITRAIQAAQREGVEHVTLAPGIMAPSPGVCAWHLMFLLSFANWFSGVNRDRPKSYLGLGAFNLVRASAYQECGGYEALRLTVLDDVKLGLLLRRACKRTRAFLGADDVKCHWGTNLTSMIQIMEKNYFAAVDFRVPLALGCCVLMVLLSCIIVMGVFSQTAMGFAATVSPLCLTAPAAILARRIGWSRGIGFGAPFMIPVFAWALFNSMFVTLRRGGIRWRETFYSLDKLRTGGVR
jgi:cellulose synthase/poly-beta-1,6-N-acetylglucosamine synthase-like glycosyltransferase